MTTLSHRNVLKGCQKAFYMKLTLRNAANNSIHCVPGTALNAIYTRVNSILTMNIPILNEETERFASGPRDSKWGDKTQTYAVSTQYHHSFLFLYYRNCSVCYDSPMRTRW